MADNFHASAVVLGDRGIVIAGPSGAGKSQLALALIADVQASGRFARLVADDQIFLVAHNGCLICSAPQTIAGLVEVRGLGPRPVVHEPRAPVDLLVRLVQLSAAERFPEAETELLFGCAVRLLSLPVNNPHAAKLGVLAELALPPFS
jgi:serine kinase of HPr protein (carbohydrate metabolism regulator)